MTVDPKRRSDGLLTAEGGVDSGNAPNLIAANKLAFATNTSFRGGWMTCRPGLKKRELSFDTADNEVAFKEALFQTVESYTNDSGRGSLISMQSGSVFQTEITPVGAFTVKNISIAGDLNAPNLDQAWAIQSENFFLIQDGQSKPYIFNGGSARRAKETEIPVGRQMAYYMGRIWIAKGREYVAGDILFGPSGTPSLGFRDSILSMTENTFLSEGGAFGVPSQSGEIVAIRPIANINTALGQGELVVFTENSVFATLVPQDRATWKTTTQPLQRMIQLENGATSQASVVNVNEDLYYRSDDGIRSLAYAVRNAGQPGNTPVSNEMDRVLSRDSDYFLKYASGVKFNNRLLMTCAPGFKQGRGGYFKALVVLDFDPITGMAQKRPPAWNGIWTGLNILKIVTVRHLGVMRCFMYALNQNDEIELWELTKDAQFDHNGEADVRIQWSPETRSMDFGSKFDMIQLFSGDIFMDRLSGTVNVDVDFRPDSHPCWIDWDSWEDCSKTTFCEEDFGTCPTLPNYHEQYRPKRQLVQPPDTFDPITKSKYRNGYEFQVKLNITGFCRVKQIRLNAYDVQEPPYGRQL